MKKLILLSIIIFSACGIQPDKTSIRIGGPTDPELEPYKIEFIDNYYRYTGTSINIDSISVSFIPTLENGWAGVCNTQGRAKWIQISREVWTYLSNATRTALIYHELGHCALNKNHIPTISQGGRRSVMNTPIPNDFFAREDSYLRELFLNQIF